MFREACFRNEDTDEQLRSLKLFKGMEIAQTNREPLRKKRKERSA